jgi:hypothetical protein
MQEGGYKMNVTPVVIFISLFFVGCTVINHESKMSASRIASVSADLCNASPLVGQVTNEKLAIDYSIKKIDEGKFEIGIERAQKLSQELKDYQAKWEAINKTFTPYCQSFQSCKLMQMIWFNRNDDEVCKVERDEYFKMTHETYELFKNMGEFRAKNPDISTDK